MVPRDLMGQRRLVIWTPFGQWFETLGPLEFEVGLPPQLYIFFVPLILRLQVIRNGVITFGKRLSLMIYESGLKYWWYVNLFSFWAAFLWQGIHLHGGSVPYTLHWEYRQPEWRRLIALFCPRRFYATTQCHRIVLQHPTPMSLVPLPIPLKPQTSPLWLSRPLRYAFIYHQLEI